MGKKDVDASMEDEEEESTVVLSPIANPLAKDKLVKKILKLVKAGENEHLARYLTCRAVGPCCVVGGGGCRQYRLAGGLVPWRALYFRPVCMPWLVSSVPVPRVTPIQSLLLCVQRPRARRCGEESRRWSRLCARARKVSV